MAKANQALINNILDMRQKLAKLEAQAGLSKQDKPRGIAHLEPVDKKPLKRDGPYYVCEHSIYDAHNAIMLEAEQVIQTHCVKWVRRMGGLLSEESNRLPPKYDPSHVLILTGCIEDKDDTEGATIEGEAEVVDGQEEAPQTGRRFSRRS